MLSGHNPEPMKKFLLLLVFTVAIAGSCERQKITIDPDNLLLGLWNFSDFTGNTNTFTRANEFTDNTGYRFMDDGSLIEHKNSGWCATPPVSYADFPGSWVIINDTLVEVTSEYWGGVMTYRIDIEYIDRETLRFSIINLE